MVDAEALLPCPFCGHDAMLVDEFNIQCPNVLCLQPRVCAPDGDAAEFWNMRTDKSLSTSINFPETDKSDVDTDHYVRRLEKAICEAAKALGVATGAEHSVFEMLDVIKATRVDKSAVIAAIKALPRYSSGYKGGVEGMFRDDVGQSLNRREVLAKLKEVLNAS